MHEVVRSDFQSIKQSTQSTIILSLSFFITFDIFKIERRTKDSEFRLSQNFTLIRIFHPMIADQTSFNSLLGDTIVLSQKVQL